MRKVAKVVAEERAAMAAHRAIHSDANHFSSGEKNGLEHGSRQFSTSPTLSDRLKRASVATSRTRGKRH